MTGIPDKVTIGGIERQTFFEELSEAGVTSPAIRFVGDVTVQLSGTATNIEAIVERSSQDPNGASANWAPAEDEPFSGNLANGISPRPYVEPAVGWWRVRVPTLDGGYVRINMSGGDA